MFVFHENKVSFEMKSLSSLFEGIFQFVTFFRWVVTLFEDTSVFTFFLEGLRTFFYFFLQQP